MCAVRGMIWVCNGGFGEAAEGVEGQEEADSDGREVLRLECEEVAVHINGPEERDYGQKQNTCCPEYDEGNQDSDTVF